MLIEPWSLLNSRSKVPLAVSYLLVISITLLLVTHHCNLGYHLYFCFLFASSVFYKNSFVRLQTYLDFSGNYHSGIHNQSCKDLLFLNEIKSGHTHTNTQRHTHRDTSTPPTGTSFGATIQLPITSNRSKHCLVDITGKTFLSELLSLHKNSK